MRVELSPLTDLVSPSVSGVRAAQVRFAPEDAALEGLLAGQLHSEERALAATLSPQRRLSFLAGRLALRAALPDGEGDASGHPLLRTERGAPSLPRGITGSISHKRTIAVALAAPTRIAGGTVDTIGIDVEERAHLLQVHRDISRRILTPAEMMRIADYNGDERFDLVLLCFALKEAVYKAIDPFVHRHVRFTEVELLFGADPLAMTGESRVDLHLPELSEERVVVSTRWQRSDEHIFAVASSVVR